MDELAGRFQPVGVDELVGAVSDGHRLRPRSVVVTFDDAYRDFADVAWPIMRERGIPVVLFVPTSYPDRPSRRFWWDELYAALAATGSSYWRLVGIDGSTPAEAFRSVRDDIKSMPDDVAMSRIRDMVSVLDEKSDRSPQPAVERVLGWAELRVLASQGVALAPHSRSHPMLDRVEPDRLDGEIRGSLDDMYEQLGPDLVTPVFAYPSGGHDPRVREAVRRAGLTAAFTTERGLVDLERSDRFRLPRLNVGHDSSVAIVAAEAAIRRVGNVHRGARRSGLG
jgi:peptidoglycan/xylan/chitin deacetylase (PgdA/CDA1 family)